MSLMTEAVTTFTISPTFKPIRLNKHSTIVKRWIQVKVITSAYRPVVNYSIREALSEYVPVKKKRNTFAIVESEREVARFYVSNIYDYKYHNPEIGQTEDQTERAYFATMLDAIARGDWRGETADSTVQWFFKRTEVEPLKRKSWVKKYFPEYWQKQYDDHFKPIVDALVNPHE